jgi:titin
VTGEPAPTVTYDWEAADDTTFTTTTVVATTTTPSWTPDNSVADKFVRVTATADNGISTPTTVTSSAFGPIAAVNAAPAITAATITGTAQVGVALTAGVTGLTGYPTPSVTYQWELAPDGSSPFTGVGTGATYTPSAGDLGSLVRVVATADNGIGSAVVATSSATAAVIAGLGSGGPSNTPATPVPPDVPSNVQVIAGDESVTVSWEAPANTGAFPVSTYQVMTAENTQRCLTDDTTCVISGLTNGSEYSFRVRALSGAGWSTWSAASDVAIPTHAIEPTLTLSRQSRSTSIVTLSGSAVAIADGQKVRIRVSVAKSKGRGWKRYRTITAIRLADGGFTVDVTMRGKRMRVLAKTSGAPRSNIIVLRR